MTDSRLEEAARLDDICGLARCGHRRQSHSTAAELDAQFPAKAPHAYGHCRACCDPEGDDYTGCEHDFVEPVRAALSAEVDSRLEEAARTALEHWISSEPGRAWARSYDFLWTAAYAAAMSAEVAPAPSLLSSATEKEAWERALALTDGSDEQVAALDTLVRAVEVAVRAEVAPAPTDRVDSYVMAPSDVELASWRQHGFSDAAIAWVTSHVPFGSDRRLHALQAFDAAASGVQPAADDARLAEIEARWAAATAGPWRWFNAHANGGWGDEETLYGGDNTPIISSDGGYWPDEGSPDHVALACAREDIDALLSLLRSRTVAPPAAPDGGEAGHA